MFAVAARTHNEGLLRAICSISGIDLNQADERGETPLMTCVAARFAVGVRMLGDEETVNINHRNFQRETALTIAAARNQTDIVRYLIAHPRFDAEASNASLALLHAIGCHARDTPDLIMPLDFNINRPARAKVLKHGLQVLASAAQPKRTPLVLALKERAAAIANQILIHPRFVPSKSCIGSALFAAVQLGDLATFQAIFRLNEEDVNVENSHNETLFVYCCLRGSLPILQTIIQSQSFHPTPRELAHAACATVRSDNGLFVPVLSRLANLDWNLTFPPGINGDRTTGWPQRHFVGPQMGFGLSNMYPDPVPGSTPFISAIRYRRENVLRALLAEPGLNKSCRGEYGQTCLWELSQAHMDFFQANDLFSQIDLNAQDVNGNTAIMYALISGQRDVLTMLLRKGVDLDVRNNNGETLWELAHTIHRVEAPSQPTDRDVLLRRVLALMGCAPVPVFPVSDPPW
jgi:ankyrin repeat protein